MGTDEVLEASNVNTDRSIAEDLPTIVRTFGLGDVRDVVVLTTGIMNWNWRLETSAGTYAVKLLCDVPADLACRNAAVLEGLAAAGLPVCAPQRTPDGKALLSIGPRDYLVSSWGEGVHHEGTKLSLATVESLGAVIAQIHDLLSAQAGVSLPHADVRPWSKVTAPEAAIAKADRLLRLITARPEPTAFDDVARELLAERKALIRRHASNAPMAGPAPGPFGWTHGDLQYRNILWADGAVTAVLDWDRIAVKPLGEEVARTAQVQFSGEHGHLDLDRVAAFVTGYRSLRPLSRADLADAVERLWWKRMSDYWIFEFHYDRADHGPDALLEPSERLLAWWTQHRHSVQEAFAVGA
jgi:Ser/Thr protein kinase RdoA (MazF antagonist)